MSHTTKTRRPRTVRLSDSELAELREAAARLDGLGWTRFLRRAGLATARRIIRPATVDVEGEPVPLTNNRGSHQ